MGLFLFGDQVGLECHGHGNRVGQVVAGQSGHIAGPVGHRAVDAVGESGHRGAELFQALLVGRGHDGVLAGDVPPDPGDLLGRGGLGYDPGGLGIGPDVELCGG